MLFAGSFLTAGGRCQPSTSYHRQDRFHTGCRTTPQESVFSAATVRNSKSVGLRLDRKPDALKGGASGRVIEPGNSVDSRLIRMVAGVDRKIMPPIGQRPYRSGNRRFARVDRQGFDWPVTSTLQPKGSVHWAFQSVALPPTPPVRHTQWVRNPIDSFVLARLQSENIEPSPDGSKNVLIRRLSLDITGLLPTPKETDDFLNDTRPDAYERLSRGYSIRRILEKKWARYWLDLARYADSDGYEKDRSRPWAWRYRQWVIDALNRDLPFDEFTRQQLAGDLMPGRDLDTLVATDSIEITLTNREGGTDPEQFRDEEVLDRAATLGTVWLVLTVGCAQCHDHKYDPIKARKSSTSSLRSSTQRRK